MRKSLLLYVLFVCNLYCYAQTDTRTVVGVAKFTCDEDSPYIGLVTEKVVEMLTKAKCFKVVDRTSIDKVKAELELQKSEAFIDSKNLVEQDVAVAAEKMITGHIVKIPIYAIRNTDGGIKGYKGSIAFQMKVIDVATGLSTEATSFMGKASDLMLSPQSAVTNAMSSIQSEIEEYFRINFPAKAKILKILTSKGDGAAIILIGVGKMQGVKIGDRFIVESIEILDGQPYPTELGEIEVLKLSGESFAECKVPKKIGLAIQELFRAAKCLECKLKIK